MFVGCVLVLCSLQTGTDAPPGKMPPWNPGLRVVTVTTKASRTDFRNVQTVSVVLQIQPKYHVYANSQPDPGMKYNEMDLRVRTRNPKTQVKVIYPKAREHNDGLDRYTLYEGEVEIQAIVQRAEGDDSPLEGSLFFTANGRSV